MLILKILYQLNPQKNTKKALSILETKFGLKSEIKTNINIRTTLDLLGEFEVFDVKPGYNMLEKSLDDQSFSIMVPTFIVKKGDFEEETDYAN